MATPETTFLQEIDVPLASLQLSLNNAVSTLNRGTADDILLCKSLLQESQTELHTAKSILRDRRQLLASQESSDSVEHADEEVKYGSSNEKILFFCQNLNDENKCKTLVAQIQNRIEECMQKSALEIVILDFSQCTHWEDFCVAHLGKISLFCKENALLLFSARVSKKLGYFFSEHGIASLFPDITELKKS